ncbi:hypothetical protein GCM10020254_50820 [Streptomyces goshikiensis]
MGRRIAVLRRLAHPSKDDPAAGPVSVVVAPIRSVLQPQVKGLGDLVPVSLRQGESADLGEVTQALAAAAYARVELVEKRGEFAVRGGILDVFPPTEEHPLRVEFWGDDVEEIRYFKVADQRSLEVAEHGLWAPPCRELLLTDEVRERAAALAVEHPELGELLNKIAEGIAVEGMESLAPVLVDDMELLIDVPARRGHGRGLRPRAGPDPGRRPGGDLAGVPDGLLGCHRGRRRRPPSTSARPPCAGSRTSATTPASSA